MTCVDAPGTPARAQAAVRRVDPGIMPSFPRAVRSLSLAGLLAVAVAGGAASSGTEPVAAAVPSAAPDRTWHVSASAAAGGIGTAARPFAGVQPGLDAARPGDTVLVHPGRYVGTVRTVRGGVAGRPVVLRGLPGAVLSGTSPRHDRLLTVGHDWVVVTGFTLTTADKGVWLQHAAHVVVRGNRITGMGGECVRVKYLSRHNEVSGNTIGPCGLVGYTGRDGHKNGEGVYVGTAPEQLDRNPTPVPDTSDDNLVRGNVIRVVAECVDVKESARRTLVERNDCAGGIDPKGGGISSRGDRSVIRYNTVRDYAGKGVRLGGDEPGQGVLNDVYGNSLRRTGGHAVGAMRMPQGRVCGNAVGENAAGVVNVVLPVTAPCP